MQNKITPNKSEVKNLKHTFTPSEKEALGGDLARAVGTARNIEAEFDSVKASYKAKTSEAEARIDSLSTSLNNGFEMRNEKCVVVFRPKDRLKDYYLESEFEEKDGKAPVQLTESMTNEDFAMELIQAESKFEFREESPLFMATDNDRGVLVIGKFGQKWFSALRVKIGKLELAEKLDSEQRAFKARPDAVEFAVKRGLDWLKKNLKDHSKGFEPSFLGLIEANKERVE